MTDEAVERSALDRNAESDFLAWIAERGTGVRWAYGRWLEDPQGNMDEGSYCPDCAVIQRYVERHNKTRYTRISGWDESQSQDSPTWCERCGVLLHHSPTEYMIEEEWSFWVDPHRELDATDFAILHNLMTCGGLYEMQRDKWWPVLEPHAKRMMQNKEKAIAL